jgi:hypothetical protein
MKPLCLALLIFLAAIAVAEWLLPDLNFILFG